MRRSVVLTVLSLVILVGTACQNRGNPVLAKVGARTIRAEDYIESYRRISPEFRPDLTLPEAKEEFLRNVVYKEIMLQEAYERGLDEDQTLQMRLAEAQQKILLPELVAEVTKNRPEPGEDELEFLRRALRHHYHIRLIRTEDRAAAEAALAEFGRGKSFEDLAAEYDEGNLAERKGDLGWQGMESFPADFRTYIIDLKPGESTDILERDNAFHIIYLEDKKEIESLDEEKLETRVRAVWMNEWTQKMMSDFLTGLREEKDYEVNEELQKELADRFRESTPSGKPAGADMADWPAFSPAEKRAELASWQGGNLTLDELLAQVQEVPVRMRPDMANPAAVRLLVEQYTGTEILVEEARRRGIDKRQDIAWELQKAFERRMLRRLRGMIVAGAAPTEEEMRAFYDENQLAYQGPEEYRVSVVVVADSTEAAEIKDQLFAGADIADVARKKSIHRSARKGGDLGWIKLEDYAELGPMLLAVRPHSASPPFEALGGYTILRVQETRGTRQLTYEEARQRIGRTLEPQAQDALLTSWVEEKAAEVAKMYPERLASMVIPPELLPPPPAEGEETGGEETGEATPQEESEEEGP